MRFLILYPSYHHDFAQNLMQLFEPETITIADESYNESVEAILSSYDFIIFLISPQFLASSRLMDIETQFNRRVLNFNVVTAFTFRFWIDSQPIPQERRNAGHLETDNVRVIHDKVMDLWAWLNEPSPQPAPTTYAPISESERLTPEEIIQWMESLATRQAGIKGPNNQSDEVKRNDEA